MNSIDDLNIFYQELETWLHSGGQPDMLDKLTTAKASSMTGLENIFNMTDVLIEFQDSLPPHLPKTLKANWHKAIKIGSQAGQSQA